MKPLALLFFFLSFVLLVCESYFLYLRFSPRKLSFNNYQQSTYAAQAAQPARLLIPAVNIDAPVLPITISNNSWKTTNNGISFIQNSTVPGKKGNSVFYGHNWISILGNLPRVKPGQTIEVVMSNGEHKHFVIEYTAVVTPDKTEIINQTSDKRLTIYTCTGFLDSKRFVAVAKAV